MLCDYNPAVESVNFRDGVIFTADDPCIWVVYPAGAAGDLLITMLDRHYLRTGCEYRGIDSRGRVMVYTSDYEMIDLALLQHGSVQFDQQWFWDFSDQLGRRNLTYSMLDQVIFGCHLYTATDIAGIIKSFPAAKIINIYCKDSQASAIVKNMAAYKLRSREPVPLTGAADPEILDLVQHPQVLNVPFGFLFARSSYARYYRAIRAFLGLDGALIDFDYMKFYLSRQHPELRAQLEHYSQEL